jgi:hypothetical protein
MSALTIIIHRGFGPLEFGMLPEKVEELIGPPEEAETLEGVDSSSLVWHYWQRGFTLFFEIDLMKRFCCVEIDSGADASLWGQAIGPWTEGAAMELFRKNGFDDFQEEKEDWGEKRITSDAAMVDMYFVQGNMVCLNYSVVLPDSLTLLSIN